MYIMDSFWRGQAPSIKLYGGGLVSKLPPLGTYHTFHYEVLVLHRAVLVLGSSSYTKFGDVILANFIIRHITL